MIRRCPLQRRMVQRKAQRFTAPRRHAQGEQTGWQCDFAADMAKEPCTQAVQITIGRTSRHMDIKGCRQMWQQIGQAAPVAVFQPVIIGLGIAVIGINKA